MVVVLNGVAAVVLVRTLDKQQFAWFTIAGSMAALLSALNEGGIATAVMARGGEVWTDRVRLSALIIAALSMLNRTAIVGALVVGPLLVFLLSHTDAPAWTILSILVLVVGPQWVATRAAILACANRLHSRVRQLQAADLMTAGCRCFLTLVPAALGQLDVQVALLAVAVSALLHAKLVAWQLTGILDATAAEKDVAPFRTAIVRTMRNMYPNNLFGCVQGQLATGLLSVFGTTSRVADLGALNRLSFVSTLLAAPLGHLVSPGFSRSHKSTRLVTLFLTTLCGYLLILFAFLVLVAWKAVWVLDLFGPQYSHLHDELLLVSAGLCLNFINQIFWTLNFSRGWVAVVWLNIPLTVVVQVSVISLMDVSTVAGAALLACITTVPALLLGVGVAARGLSTLGSFNGTHR